MCDNVLIDTGQNYDVNLRDVFLEQLKIRQPNYRLGAVGSFTEQLAIMLPQLESILLNEKPDAFLVLGDTNSSLGAIVARRLGIRVFHMEAGNRCYDNKVPEELNRRIIDHSSDILLPYTERSRANLLSEGIESRRIYVTGNPIKEVLDSCEDWINASDIMNRLEVNPGKYFLVTLHRAENVDNPDRLKKFVECFNYLTTQYAHQIIWTVHPRTQKYLEQYTFRDGIVATQPLGFFEFIKLEKNAYCVLTDSGTVQEECSIFGVPVVTLRDTTERPETIETGSNFISGTDSILQGIEAVTTLEMGRIPDEYTVDNVSDTVCKIVLGYYV